MSPSRFATRSLLSVIDPLIAIPISPLLILLSLSICLGCSTVHLKPKVTDVADYSREKDIKTYIISLDSRMDEEAYQIWSQEHIETLQLDQDNPDYQGIPIYEIHYHFVLREARYRPRRIAFLVWRRSTEDVTKLEHLFTYIGSRVPMQNWILR